MQYASFKVIEETKINKFLKEHEDHLLKGGTTFAGDRICFMYSIDPQPPTPAPPPAAVSFDEEFHNALLQAVSNEIITKTGQLFVADAHERFLRSQALQGATSTSKVVDAANSKQAEEKQLRIMHSILEELKEKKWPALSSTAISKT